MTATVSGIHLSGTHAARPGAAGPPAGTLYSCTTDSLIYRTDGTSWSTWATLGSVGGSVATDAIWDVAGDVAVGSGANTAARLAIGDAGGALSRVNGAVAWNSGAAFPTAATGDRYWRTDLGLEFYYDGTRWLSTTQFSVEMKNEENITWPLAANSSIAFRGAPPFGDTYDIWMETWYTLSQVLTTNTGSAYWTATLRKFDSAGTTADLCNFTTAADTVDVFYNKEVSIGALLGAYEGFAIGATKTSTPGNFRLHGGRIACRMVGT